MNDITKYRPPNLLKYFSFFILIGISFLLYSSRFYPILNSDDGITILMIHYFNPLTDLYFWGQDRFGSILPLLGQLFYRGFGLSEIMAESLSHYLIIILGYFSISSFLKNNLLKFALAIIWFFPPFHMLDFLRNTLGLECSIFCIGFYLLHQSFSCRSISNKKSIVYYILSVVAFSIALWVSDLAIISILLLVIYGFFYNNINSDIKTQNMWKPISIKKLVFTILYACFTIAFILYAKSISEESTGYSAFVSFHELLNSAGIVVLSLKQLFLFQSNETGTSLYCYGMLILIMLIISNLRFAKLNKSKLLLITFFILQAMAIIFIILISKWAYQAEVGRRYFVSVYAASWMSLLICLDQQEFRHKNLQIVALFILFVTLIIGGAGTQYNIRYIWPKTAVPKVKQLAEFKKLGDVGIVANYWNSYVIACINPGKIVATPHQNDTPRNVRFTYEVFQKPSFLIIRDGWLEKFPDSLYQYGHLLKKAGNEQYVGGCYVCRYSSIRQ